MSDAPLITIAAFLFVAGVLAAAEGISRWGAIGPAASRRLVHVVVGLTAGLLPLWFESVTPFYPVAAAALVVTWIDSQRGVLRSVHNVRRRTYGTAAFAAAFIIAAAIGWTLMPDRVFAFSASLLVLAVADPVAGVAGERFGAGHDSPATKSLEGSAVFFVAAAVVLSAVLVLWDLPRSPSTMALVLTVLLCAAAATAAEHVSSGGLDNLAIVVAVLLVLHLTFLPSASDLSIALAAIVPVVFAYASYRARLLSRSGSIVAALLAATIVLMWDWRWVVPGLLFFASSSALSRLGRALKDPLERKLAKGPVRDPVQVLANGGVPWVMLLGAAFLPFDLWYLGFAGAFATAAADTWATEVGMLARARPLDVRTWRRVSPGSSGAISVQGTLASLCGALLIAWSASLFVQDPRGHGLVTILILVTAGCAGSVVDTLLGAFLQASYVDERGETTEREQGNRLVRGWRWLNNDCVNGAAGLAGAFVAIGLAVAFRM